MNHVTVDLIELTERLILIRKKPTTPENFQQYPNLLQEFRDAVASCKDPEMLRTVLKVDRGYFLPASDRQRTIERLLKIGGRNPESIRMYAKQLELFGDVDEFGSENFEVEKRIAKLYKEADKLENKDK